MKTYKPNSTTIDWADFTLNPIVGCNYGCKYCYAKTINDRFKFVKDWSKPEFFPERLNFRVPKMPKERNPIAAQLSPDKPIVFVESMGDICGWSNEEEEQWSVQILLACLEHYESNFFFVSKRSYMFGDLFDSDKYLPNIYLGTTLNRGIDMNRKFTDTITQTEVSEVTGHFCHVFANIEPIQGSFEGVDLSMFEFAIVGPETGKRKGIYIPTKEEILSVKHEKVYYKKGVYDLYPETRK